MTSRASEQFITLMPGLFYPPFCLLWQTFRPSSVFSGKRKMVDNRLIINHLRERKTETEPWVSFRYVSICYGVLWLFRSPISSSPYAPCCISMRQYKDTQSFRQKQIFYSICVGGVIYRTRRNPSGRTIPPAPPLPAGRL